MTSGGVPHDLWREAGRNRDVGIEKLLFVVFSSNATGGLTSLKSSFLFSRIVLFTHTPGRLMRASHAVGSSPLGASVLFWGQR